MSQSTFYLGNEAIVRGALEAGVDFAAAYPGTPSSEIIERLAAVADQRNLHVEWSINEKVAVEGAAAAANAGLTAVAAMKNAGMAVALDFLTHLSMTGLGDADGANVVVVCDDPNAHSSGDETDTRWLARFAYAPLMEPTTVPEAREMMAWAFGLSQRHKAWVMLRSCTRLSHASSIVESGELPPLAPKKARAQVEKCLTPYLARPKHQAVLEKLARVKEEFEASPFNGYEGPDSPELLVVAAGSGYMCALEAREILGLADKVGVLKLATLWPFPSALVAKHLATVKKVLVLEEVDPFVESLVSQTIGEAGFSGIEVLGKSGGQVTAFGEMTPERAMEAMGGVFGLSHQPRSAQYQEKLVAAGKNLISRGLTWCPGCPHRASFWALDKAIKATKEEVFVTGDIGCYTLDVFPEGKCQMNLLHAMGSSTGLAGGFGKLAQFGGEQKVISICGDSTFFHSAFPGLLNAVHHQADMIHVILDNGATAMTGFQAHPGTEYDAEGKQAHQVDPVALCQALGAPVVVADPFDLKATTKAFRDLLKAEPGVKVLVLRRVCELVRMKKEKSKPVTLKVDQEKCKGEKCGVCYGSFRCPAFALDSEGGKARIREEACPGCGVCAQICPFGAIVEEEQA